MLRGQYETRDAWDGDWRDWYALLKVGGARIDTLV